MMQASPVGGKWQNKCINITDYCCGIYSNKGGLDPFQMAAFIQHEKARQNPSNGRFGFYAGIDSGLNDNFLYVINFWNGKVFN